MQFLNEKHLLNKFQVCIILFRKIKQSRVYMNYVQIAGFLGADAETRFTSSGQKVTTLRVACNSRRSGKEETMWWRVTIWGEQFDRLMTYLKKGSAIMVYGEMSNPEIYTGKNGQPQTSLNMVAHHISFSPFGRPKSQEQGQGHMQDENQQGQALQTPEAVANTSSAPGDSFSDADIPF